MFLLDRGVLGESLARGGPLSSLLFRPSLLKTLRPRGDTNASIDKLATSAFFFLLLGVAFESLPRFVDVLLLRLGFREKLPGSALALAPRSPDDDERRGGVSASSLEARVSKPDPCWTIGASE